MAAVLAPFRIDQIENGCMGMFATRDLARDEVIFTEEALFQTSTASFFNRDLMGDAHYRNLQMQLREFAKSHAQKEGAAKYPDEVRAVLDEIMDITCTHAVQALEASSRDRIWALHDCFVPAAGEVCA